MQPYTVALCRPDVASVFDAQGHIREGALDHNIGLYCDLIQHAADRFDAKLIVFPQFGLTGFVTLGSPNWEGASMTFPGRELERIGRAAQRAGVYVLVPGSEKHEAFPGRYFISAAIMTPSGDLGLTYRKNYTISMRLSPVDVYSRFVDLFGQDAFTPVLNTPLGTLGVVIGAEPHYPELTRALALRGAEIILNPMAAPVLDYMERPGADHVRAVRAFENVAYLASVNGVESAIPSQAWDFEGRPIALTSDDARFTLATIDIDGLRNARSRPAANLLAQIQPQIAADPRTLPLWPSDAFAEQAPNCADDLLAVEARVWQGLQALGRGKPPAS
jgi:predicted amidohydrolase